MDHILLYIRRRPPLPSHDAVKTKLVENVALSLNRHCSTALVRGLYGGDLGTKGLFFDPFIYAASHPLEIMA